MSDLDVDPEFEAHLRRVLTTVAHTIGEPANETLLQSATSPPARLRRTRRLITAAAIGLIGVAVGVGLTQIVDNDPSPHASPDTNPESSSANPELVAIAQECRTEIAAKRDQVPELPDVDLPDPSTSHLVMFENDAMNSRQLLVASDTAVFLCRLTAPGTAVALARADGKAFPLDPSTDALGNNV